MAKKNLAVMSVSALEAEMARAHANLNTFASLVAILEGGCVYGGMGSDVAANTIIARCQKEQQRLLKIYDAIREETAKRRLTMRM